MSTGTITTRPATAADIAEFYGKMPGRSVRAKIYEIDGDAVGVLGHYIEDGIKVVFSDIKRPAPKMAIWREAKAIMDNLKGPAVCVAMDGSERFLERLGWKYVDMSDEGAVYQWQA